MGIKLVYTKHHCLVYTSFIATSFEKTFVKRWNQLCRISGFGRPIYHFPVKANFMGLTEGTAVQINKFYMERLPLSGVQLDVDVLNNRRHQVIGVFIPAGLALTALVQFAWYNLTTPARRISEEPAPGWEVPAGFDYHHLAPTPNNVATWKKRQEMGHQEWYYGMGDKFGICNEAHPYYHSMDHGGGH